MSAEGGTPHLLTTGPTENYIPSWSHDGQWIYFCSWRTGRQEVWKISPDGRNPQQVTKNGGQATFGSWDGQWVYYKQKAAPLGTIWRVPVNGGAEAVFMPAPVVGRNFAVTGNGIYFMGYNGTATTINVYRFDTRKIESILTLSARATIGLTVSPDEKRILYSQFDHEGSNIMLVENYD